MFQWASREYWSEMILKFFERARSFMAGLRSALTPSDVAWRGAAIAVHLLSAVTVCAFFAVFFLQDFTWHKIPAFFTQVGSVFLAGTALLLMVEIAQRIPVAFRIAIFVFAPFVVLSLSMGSDVAMLVTGVTALLVASFVGAGIAVLRGNGYRTAGQVGALVVLLLGSCGGIVGLYMIFSDKPAANPSLEGFVLEDRTLDLPNPGLPGRYEVLSLTYGSGKDQPRQAFGESTDLVARTVDGTKLIGNWDGVTGWLRSMYWGFDATELPLQANVWYPDGEGPFPLVLMVHGNHSMEDFSDPGYAYLGELFASRGIILASVDENFLNSSISARINVFAERPGLSEENDARGWLLLQHLAQWRDWNEEAGHRFEGKLDMERLALIGHSRGGEAVGIAAAFNKLDRYPDDATLEFDFDFKLRGVIAIAPVYGQYQPRGRYTPIRDVSYFTIHGDMDGDVQSFEGMAQYSRVSFEDDEFHFRSGLYVLGANHGQFNTTWANTDMSLFRAWALDLGGIMDGEAQRDVARVYFGAFLDVVLRGRTEYLPVFRDARYAAAWLPNTFFINQYSSSGERIVVDFEEDIDPATLTLPGGRITGRHLSKWYEIGNELKQDELDTHSAVFAWDDAFSGDTASVDFGMPNSGVAGNLEDVLVISLSAVDTGTLPDDWEPDGEHADRQAGEDDVDDEKNQPLDWTIRLTDPAGTSASLPLSHDSVLYPLIKALPRRAGFLDDGDPSEVLFRHFELPLADFAANNPGLDVTSIAQISFIFNRSRKGAIMIDEIALMRIN